jgi:hypothetical protein
VAFLIGIVPETFLTFLQEIYRAKWIRRFTSEIEEPVPLKNLEGIDLYDRAPAAGRRHRQHRGMANHDLIDLLLETRIPAARLIDWMDQAILHPHARCPPASTNALRRAGIRTASDLVTVDGKHRGALISTLVRSMNAEKSELEKVFGGARREPARRRVEWTTSAYWRTGSAVHERYDHPPGRGIDDERQPRPDLYRRTNGGQWSAP